MKKKYVKATTEVIKTEVCNMLAVSVGISNSITGSDANMSRDDNWDEFWD